MRITSGIRCFLGWVESLASGLRGGRGLRSALRGVAGVGEPLADVDPAAAQLVELALLLLVERAAREPPEDPLRLQLLHLLAHQLEALQELVHGRERGAGPAGDA